MSYLHDIKNCICRFDPVSKIILLCGYVLFLFTFLFGLLLYLHFSSSGDCTTGAYWFGEYITLSNEILSVCWIPVFLFECLFLAQKIKK